MTRQTISGGRRVYEVPVGMYLYLPADSSRWVVASKLMLLEVISDLKEINCRDALHGMTLDSAIDGIVSFGIPDINTCCTWLRDEWVCTFCGATAGPVDTLHCLDCGHAICNRCNRRPFDHCPIPGCGKQIIIKADQREQTRKIDCWVGRVCILEKSYTKVQRVGPTQHTNGIQDPLLWYLRDNDVLIHLALYCMARTLEATNSPFIDFPIISYRASDSFPILLAYLVWKRWRDENNGSRSLLPNSPGFVASMLQYHLPRSWTLPLPFRR